MGIKLIANLIKKSIFMVMQLSIINVALSFSNYPINIDHQLFNRGTFRNGKMINGRFKFQNGY